MIGFVFSKVTLWPLFLLETRRYINFLSIKLRIYIYIHIYNYQTILIKQIRWLKLSSIIMWLLMLNIYYIVLVSNYNTIFSKLGVCF
jgi:hypothetical protein